MTATILVDIAPSNSEYAIVMGAPLITRLCPRQIGKNQVCNIADRLHAPAAFRHKLHVA